MPHVGRALVAIAVLLPLALLTGPAVAQQSEADVFVAQAILAYEDKRYDEALALLADALKLDPNSVDALYYTGLVHLARQRPDLAIPPLEQARRASGADTSVLYQLGLAYFALERYDEAEPLLTTVFSRDPYIDGIAYYVGFLRYRRKDYQGAVRAFATGRTSDPGLQQLTRFYNGLALAMLGLPERAAAEVDAALRAQPSSSLTGPAERLRSSILAARERERRFSVELRAGMFYDTNVPVTPSPSEDSTAEAVRTRDKQSKGELLAVRFDYAFLRTGSWEAAVTYSFFQSIDNELPHFNIQSHLGAVGATYRDAALGLPYQLGVQYSFDTLTLGGEDFLRRHTAVAFASLVENTRNLTTLQLRYQTKNFGDDPDDRHEVRDARNWMAGATHVFRFAQDRHFIRLGYQRDVEEAGRNWEYAGNRYLVGGQYTLPWWGTRLRYDGDLHHRDYDHLHTLLPASHPKTRRRHDDELTHVLRLEQPLPAGFTLAAEWQAIVSRSTLPVFSYDRDVYSLTLIWNY